MLASILKTFAGTVTFQVSGDFTERFVNLCARHDLSVWGLKRRGKALECTCAAGDYKRLCTLRRGCRVRLRIREKHGLPFVRRRYRLRLGLPVGAALFFLVLNLLSSTIWNIEINGLDTLTETRVMQALETVGVTYGVRRASINTNNVRHQLILELPELSWAAVNLKGSTAVIELKEALTTPDPNDKTPQNLRAAREGVIIAYTVSEGRPTVQVGDAVRTGDLLVSGTVELNTGVTELKHSAGIVMALTERELEYKATYEQRITLRTGRRQTRRVLSFFNLQLPLYLGSVSYAYQKEQRVNHLTVDGVRLPLWLASADFFEIREQTEIIDRAAAEALAFDKLAALEQTELAGISIIERQLKTYADEQGIRLVGRYICEENIALPEKLLIDSSNP